jgi:hypothetical protein
MVGTEGDDVLIGSPGRDVILGLGGNDVIRGLGGDDLLCGGPGDDLIEGGDGDDQIIAGTGRDAVRGDDGTDGVYVTCGDTDRADGGPGVDKVVADAADVVADDRYPTSDGRTSNDRGEHYSVAVQSNVEAGTGDSVMFQPLDCAPRPVPQPGGPPAPEPAPPVDGVPVRYVTANQLPRLTFSQPWTSSYGTGEPTADGDDGGFARPLSCDEVIATLPPGSTYRAFSAGVDRRDGEDGGLHDGRADQYVAAAPDPTTAAALADRLLAAIHGCATTAQRVSSYRDDAVADGVRYLGVYRTATAHGQTDWFNELVAVGRHGRFVTVVVLDTGDRPAPLAQFRALARAATEQVLP